MAMKRVRAKKSLGQHFLTDLSIARRIVEALPVAQGRKVMEIGPGMGVLTDFLIELPQIDLHAFEIDAESVAYLHDKYPALQGRIHLADFLAVPLDPYLDRPVDIIGNFPYNISSQIFFRVLDYRHRVQHVVGMLQKEVAERLASPPGSKEYGILSVFLQAYYTVEYLFTVSEHVFDPPPKVKSGVIRLTRNTLDALPCNERLFRQVVKTAFGQRRKTLRNSLKPILGTAQIDEALLSERPEQLSVEQFVYLTQCIESSRLSKTNHDGEL